MLQKKRYTGIEVSEDLQGNPVYLILNLVIKKKEIFVESKYLKSSINELSSFITEKNAIFLTFTDSDVLSKKIESIDVNESNILSEGFPNLNTETFYYQIFQTLHHSFISIVRKQKIISILNEFKVTGLFVKSIFLGSLNAKYILDLIDVKTFYTYNSEIVTDGNEIISINNANPKELYYSIEGIEISSIYLNPLATLIGIIQQNAAEKGNITQKNELLLLANKREVWFRQILSYGLGSLFILLLLNFLIFHSLQKNQKQLQENIQVFKSDFERLQQKRKVVQQKEKVAQSIMNTGNTKSSYYMHTIVQQLPDAVLLENISYNPLKKPPRPGKEILVNRNTITINGYSKNENDYLLWLQRLEKVKFIKEVVILNYGTEKSLFTFNIRIHLTYDSEK